MRKKLLLIIPVIVIICIVGFVWFTVSAEVVQAQLIIESGTVEVKHVGESWISAQNGMLLYQSDYVKTGNNTSASIVLFESSVIRLDSNTEVMIQEIVQQEGETSVKIKQEAGRTWNTILNISGIDDYELQTPTTVASVRGTSFSSYVGPLTGLTDIGVARGIVYVSSILNGVVIDMIEVHGDEAVTVDPDLIDQPLVTKPFIEDDWVRTNKQKDEDIMTMGVSSYLGFSLNVKEELYRRIGPYKLELQRRYGVTDQELEVLIDGYLLGLFDLPPETPAWIREIIELS